MSLLTRLIIFVWFGAVGGGLAGLLGDFWLARAEPKLFSPPSVWSFAIGYLLGVPTAAICGLVDWCLTNIDIVELSKRMLIVSGVAFGISFVIAVSSMETLWSIAVGLLAAIPVSASSWFASRVQSQKT